MAERKYKVILDDNDVLAKEMRLNDAIIFIKALCETYFNEEEIKITLMKE